MQPFLLYSNSNHMFKVNNRNARTRCEICSGVLIVNFEHISHLVLVFSIVNFDQANADWV